ncbi:MAG: zinc ribbon domain-containing protein [Candidatus Brockarchaeota archaeon]|nr:zinc ribbon domain-containing protein [Candidatus Brockarchaeota archaeon]
MSTGGRSGNAGRSPAAGFMLGVSASFLALLLATMAAQLLEATQAAFGLRSLFEYAFVPLVVQSCLVSMYMRGRVAGLLLPLASTIAGTLLFLAVMFMPSLPLTVIVPTMYNAMIASVLGGVVGTAAGGARIGKVKTYNSDSKPRTCWACGSEIPPGAFFCQRCGEKAR